MTEPPTVYDALGGEPAVRRLVDRFYDEMDQDPEVKVLRDMHPPDLASSREKLFLFLTGWLGGPPLYVQKHGHPMLRRRHFPFAVDVAARDQWMRCMRVALAEVVEDAALRERLDGALAGLADHMRNREG